MTKSHSLENYFPAIVNSSCHLLRDNYKRILIWGAVFSMLLSGPSLAPFMTAQAQQGKEITLTAIAAEPKDRWDALFLSLIHI